MTTANVPPDEKAPPPTLEEVSPGIFAYIQLDGSWGLNNPSFLVGQNGVTAVDSSSTERRSRDFLSAIERTSEQPVSTLINTHHHLDHTFGNFVFGPEVTIVGHEACREEILNEAPTILDTAKQLFPWVEWGNIEVVAPSLTFEDRLTLYLDDLELECIFMGPAHTTNDVVVWIPARRVLITGDIIFHLGTPFALQGSVAGWLTALDRIRELGAERIIPGHGPVCGPEVIDDVAAYLRFVQERARAGFEAGAKPLEVAKDSDLGRFAEWTDRERIVGNLYRAYSELRGEAAGRPLDLALAWPDMIEYNGGKPLRCLA
ncbi:MAG: MBL fold metallo-hydrolase [Dehalococcoidia bacterium]